MWRERFKSNDSGCQQLGILRRCVVHRVINSLFWCVGIKRYTRNSPREIKALRRSGIDNEAVLAELGTYLGLDSHL
jgi:hypothetical protein